MSLAILRDHAARLGVTPIANEVLSDERFPIWTASGHPNVHHYGRGGLLRHTYEVVSLCLLNRVMFTEWGHVVDERALYLAALFHDSQKVEDYAPINAEPVGLPTETSAVKWVHARHHKLIHHVAGSAIRWCEAVARTGTCVDIKDEVTHAILSHHGLPEWGSSVKPRTRIAHLLHLSDNMSACMGHVDTIDLPYKERA